MCKKEFKKAIDKSVFPGFQGGPHENNIAAKAIAFGEILTDGYKEYARQVRKNAKVMEEELRSLGFELMFGGTDNHLLLIDVTNKGATGKEAEHALDEAGITVNKNMIPDDPRSPMDPSGIRIGTPAMTTRGMKEDEMRQVAKWIDEAIQGKDDPATLERIKNEVKEMCESFPVPGIE